jgi:hypothetical protein
MGREWKPGDVVSMTVGDEAYFDIDTIPQLMDELVSWWHNRPATIGVAGGTAHLRWIRDSFASAKVGRLVVIDPEDREQVETLRTLIASQPLTQNVATEAMQAALREYANPTPPEPEEPGTWGVVEASCVHSDERRKWVRHEDGNWWPAETYISASDLEYRESPDDWSDLENPVVVREGVES